MRLAPGCRRAQSAGSTHGQEFRRSPGLHRKRWQPAFASTGPAMVGRTESYRLVMSFHGLPRYTLDKGDPYHCECHKTGRLLAEALGLARNNTRSAFSRVSAVPNGCSRIPRQHSRRWQTGGAAGRCDLPGLPGRLSGNARRNRHRRQARVHAGRRQGIPLHSCLNERDDWIHALADLAASHLQGWPTRTSPDPASRELRALRARALGASS
jgi:ferrochelatase